MLKPTVFGSMQVVSYFSRSHLFFLPNNHEEAGVLEYRRPCYNWLTRSPFPRDCMLVFYYFNQTEVQTSIVVPSTTLISLTLPAPDSPVLCHSMFFTNLTFSPCTRYEVVWEIDDLNTAIELGREALSLCPQGRSHRSTYLNKLSSCLSARHKQLGEIDDIVEAIALANDALSLCPLGHQDRMVALDTLAFSLCARYDSFWEIEDLDEAIKLAREALSLCTPGHSHRRLYLKNLASYLRARYNRLEEIDDLNDAIFLTRDALPLFSPEHADLPELLDALASHLLARYDQLGGLDDLNEAIAMARDTQAHFPPGHPDHLISLHNLAFSLCARFERLGELDDLVEAIALARNALSHCPQGHPDRLTLLGNLSSSLHTAFERLGQIDGLNEAIVLATDAVSLCPQEHLDRLSLLNNLSLFLRARYEQLGEIHDLNQATILTRDALSHCPSGHPNRPRSLNDLSSCLHARLKRLWRADDLEEAITLSREALSLRPPGHPDRSTSLNNLATGLFSRYTQLEGTSDLNAANEVKQELFSLYAGVEYASNATSSRDLSAAKAWVNTAEEFHHPTALLAYETALRLLVQHLATLPSIPQSLGFLRPLSSSLAVDACSACLRNQSLTKAVELLEQGRAAFLGPLTCLRPPLDDVVASGPQGKALADEFTRLASLVRNILRSPSSDQHDRVSHLNQELLNVASKIRKLPGLSWFLLPTSFSDLQRAARDGPVIIVNASKYGCDALVVLANEDPVHIPLPVTNKDVQKLSLQFHTLTRGSKRTDTEKELVVFLRELWERLVFHIVKVLQTKYPPSSRIWWCPTAEFSFLPFHAAAPFREGQAGVSDLYVSSYTTTLTALIHAMRQPSLLDFAHAKKRFIAIGQAGANEQFSMGAKLDKIGRRVKDLATFTCIEEGECCISRVTHELVNNEWVHFACHGVANQEKPFESAFALHDGQFTIQRLIQCDLQNSEFAYLAACDTTAEDQGNPDDVVHLAAATQFAGFRSVVGTMWQVDDSQADKITPMFYELMIDESGCLDYTRAAHALQMTMGKVDVPMDQRVLYVHFGA